MLAESCRWCRSRSAPWRSSTSARSGRRCSRSAGRTTARGTCAKARRPGPRTPRACGCCVHTCPNSCPPTNGWWTGRRRRPRSPDALAVQAPAVPRRLFARRLDPRWVADARAELRLCAVADGRCDLVDAAGRTACDRDERLPLGAARRHERCGARRFLTFGGRRSLGDGFGIPLVVRYVLETCEDIAQTREVLARLRTRSRTT